MLLVLVTNIKSVCIWPNVKHSIGGMGLRPLEDLATSQVGLVPPLKSLICICYHNNLYICYITDLYLLPKLFVFVTLHICIYYIKDLLLLHHQFVFATTTICITRLHWMYNSLIGSRRAINTLYNIKEIYKEYKIIVERQKSIVIASESES